MSDKPHKRRQVVVDADLQVGLSVHLVGWLYVYVIAFAARANAPSIWVLISGEASTSAYSEALQRMQWFARFTVIPLAVMCACVAVQGVVFAHRVAGPIHRIKTTLRDMAQRRFPADGVRVRKADYFQDVAADLTTLIDTLRDDAGRQRRMNAETLDTARSLVEALEHGGRDRHEILALAHRTLDGAERLDRHLGAVDASTEEPTSHAEGMDVGKAAAGTG